MSEQLSMIKEGDRFGRLVVIESPIFKPNKHGHRIIHCRVRCDCGSEKIVIRKNLHYKTSSCGCRRREVTGAKCRTHGQSGTVLHRKWKAMIGRCENPNGHRYSSYGARGISVCLEWRQSFLAFRDWALASGYSDDLSIERKDVNGPYAPDNCCFIPMPDQGHNKTYSVRLTCWGDTKTIAEWTRDERCKVSQSRISYRILHGWPVLEALTIVPHVHNRITEPRNSP